MICPFGRFHARRIRNAGDVIRPSMRISATASANGGNPSVPASREDNAAIAPCSIRTTSSPSIALSASISRRTRSTPASVDSVASIAQRLGGTKSPLTASRSSVAAGVTVRVKPTVIEVANPLRSVGFRHGGPGVLLHCPANSFCLNWNDEGLCRWVRPWNRMSGSAENPGICP